MKSILCSLTLLLTAIASAQDHFAIVVKNDQTTFNYPENAEITVIDDLGNQTKVEKNEALTLNGDYTLSIKSPWQNEPEIIESEGGVLEIFILPIEQRNWTQKTEYSNEKIQHKKDSDKPSLQRKEITVSENNPNKFNLLAIFTNGLVFRLYDGEARAWLNNKEIKVANQYLVKTQDGVLKVSFNPKNGAFWYVFDN